MIWHEPELDPAIIEGLKAVVTSWPRAGASAPPTASASTPRAPARGPDVERDRGAAAAR